ncbi:Glutathione synthetase [Vanrija albida]|uniref:Glutathione synthetase n=1 Tax=Vanrija albida TaxID=181172 RepID=A0ABR3QB36_9TREE
MSLPAWPPKTSDAQLASLLNEASTYALAHGFTLLPPHPASGAPPAPTHAIAAPLSLFPTPFPRAEYTRARGIQRLYNALYARIALDWAFLDGIFEEVAKVDEFQKELWTRWRAVREELQRVQPLQLGIFRSDYLLHATGKETAIKQVEFNTIASSFGALSQKAGELHRYLAASGSFFDAAPELADATAYPDNKSLGNIAAGLADAWKAYGNPNAIVLVVTQDGERNIFDQRALQYELQATHGIKSIRHTFAELDVLAKHGGDKQALLVPNPLTPNEAPAEVAVIYYRAAYTPNDYTTGKEWDTRVFLERSAAIKCPSLALQLAGAKKVQQILAAPGQLEEFLLNPSRPDVGFGTGAGTLKQADIDALRETFTGLWPLDDSELGKEAQQLAKSHPERFVLKPQREGGGNNIYRGDIPPYLANLDAESRPGEAPKREGYILMELITPPEDVHNWLVRGGEGKPRLADVVSELGVYGVALFGDAKTVVNKEAGTLLRTKGRESDEGGVAIGISSIDSPLLV